MDTDIVCALLSLFGTLIGTLGGIVISGKLTSFRLEQLEQRVAKHNNFAERLPVVEEQIEQITHRINKLEER